jgi:hypothetical protein
MGFLARSYLRVEEVLLVFEGPESSLTYYKVRSRELCGVCQECCPVYTFFFVFLSLFCLNPHSFVMTITTLFSATKTTVAKALSTQLAYPYG